MRYFTPRPIASDPEVAAAVSSLEERTRVEAPIDVAFEEVLPIEDESRAVAVENEGEPPAAAPSEFVAMEKTANARYRDLTAYNEVAYWKLRNQVEKYQSAGELYSPERLHRYKQALLV